MKKLLLTLSLIFLISIFLNGCGEKQTIEQPLCNKPYIEYMKGQCCLDSNNNQICDTDETQKEEIIEETKIETPKEEPKKEYDIDFEISGLFVNYYYSYQQKELTLHDISYKITNKKDELDDLKIKFEVYQDEQYQKDKKILESDMFPLFEERTIKKGETVLSRTYLGLSSFPRVVGKSFDVPIKIKTYLYQGDTLLEENVRNYMIMYIYSSQSYEPEIQFVELESSHYSFDYNSIPERFSRDGKIEVMIMRSLENEIQFRIKNVGSEPIERGLTLDYYCEDKKKRFIEDMTVYDVSFKINDYYSYLEDLYKYGVSDKKYIGISIINPGEKIELTIPKLSCSTHVLLFRKGNDYYVRGY